MSQAFKIGEVRHFSITQHAKEFMTVTSCLIHIFTHSLVFLTRRRRRRRKSREKAMQGKKPIVEKKGQADEEKHQRRRGRRRSIVGYIVVLFVPTFTELKIRFSNNYNHIQRYSSPVSLGITI